MKRTVIPINGYVTEVVVDTEPDQSTVTVSGPASLHTEIIPNPRWQSLPVDGRVIIVRGDGGGADEGVQEWLHRFGERVREAGAVCVVYVDPDWELTADTLDELHRLIDERTD